MPSVIDNWPQPSLSILTVLHLLTIGAGFEITRHDNRKIWKRRCMRSTQFNDHSPFDEKPEEHHKRNQPDTLCEAIKRLGYARNNQVRLYGEVFDLVSDPVRVGELVFVDAVERKSGQVRRVRIPSTIVQIARINRRAA